MTLLTELILRALKDAANPYTVSEVKAAVNDLLNDDEETKGSRYDFDTVAITCRRMADEGKLSATKKPGSYRARYFLPGADIAWKAAREAQRKERAFAQAAQQNEETITESIGGFLSSDFPGDWTTGWRRVNQDTIIITLGDGREFSIVATLQQVQREGVCHEQ